LAFIFLRKQKNDPEFLSCKSVRGEGESGYRFISSFTLYVVVRF